MRNEAGKPSATAIRRPIYETGRLSRSGRCEGMWQYICQRQRVDGETGVVMHQNIIRPGGRTVGRHGRRTRGKKVRWAAANSRRRQDKKPVPRKGTDHLVSDNKPNAAASHVLCETGADYT